MGAMPMLVRWRSPRASTCKYVKVACILPSSLDSQKIRDDLF